MYITPTIETTEDGSQTLRHPILGDTYHSLRGAEGESMHIFIENGLRRCTGEHISVLEVGFGSGLNALLTLREAARTGKTIDYTALELYPVAEEALAGLEYWKDSDFRALHASPWEERHTIGPGFTLLKEQADLVCAPINSIFDLIFFDAFAPDTQPQLWTTEVFTRLYRVTSPGGALVTYSAKGEVKRALRTADYTVYRLPGALGKRHMLRAVKE